MMKKIVYRVLWSFFLVCGVTSRADEKVSRPPKAPPEALQAWHDDAFGVFIHWTPSVFFQGRYHGKEFERDLWGEWFMRRTRIPLKDYEDALKGWNPNAFNANEWTDLFAKSGFKYLVFVAKHHDGFAMFDSAATDYNIVDHAGFSHDPYGELCAAALKRGIHPGFYYSHGTDWRNLKGGKSKKRSPEADAYFKKIVYPQLTRLCSYAKPYVIWFDLGASQPYAGKCLEIVRKKNPNTIVSSRIGAGLGDFETGGDQSIPASKKSGAWETCMTMNWHWAWYPGDRQHKTPQELIRMLASVRARGGNLLLNIGPDVRGRIPLRDQKILLQVGDWLKKNGSAIYGVDSPPYNDLPWGVCTVKKNILFLHLFEWPSLDTLFLPGLENKIERVSFLADPEHQALSFKKVRGGYSIDLSSVRLNPIFLSEADTVLAVKYKGKLSVRTVPCLDQDLDNVFISHLARCSGGVRVRQLRHTSMEEYGPSMTVFNDNFAYQFESPTAALEWTFDNTKSNIFYVDINYANLTSTAIKATVQVGDKTLDVELPPTVCGSSKQQPQSFKHHVFGHLSIPVGRDLPLVFRLVKPMEKMEKTDKKQKTADFMLKTIRLRSAYPPLLVERGGVK